MSVGRVAEPPPLVSQARIAKYVAKGFECAVPGVRREAFAVPTSRRSIGYGSRGGIDQLFDAEAEVLNSRLYTGAEEEYIEKITGRLTAVEAATIASKVAYKLGLGIDDPPRHTHDMCYGSKVCGTGSYGFIRESFRRDVAVRLGDARRGMPLNMTFTKPFAGFTDAGRFQPSEAHLEKLYDTQKLAEVAKAEVAARAECLAMVVGMDLDDEGSDDDDNNDEEDDDNDNDDDDDDENYDCSDYSDEADEEEKETDGEAGAVESAISEIAA